MVTERSTDVRFAAVLFGPGVTLGEEILASDLAEQGLGEDEIDRRLDEAGPSGFDPRPFLERDRIPILWIYGRRGPVSASHMQRGDTRRARPGATVETSASMSSRASGRM